MSGLGRPSPIARFLGEASLGHGPFGLLGLGPEACDESQVRAALDRQLQRVAQHPEGETTEADEVRVALHAAAAQVLDPAVRRHLVEQWFAAPSRAKGAAESAAGSDRSAASVWEAATGSDVRSIRPRRRPTPTWGLVALVLVPAAVAGVLLIALIEQSRGRGAERAGPTGASGTGTPASAAPAAVAAASPAATPAAAPRVERAERAMDAAGCVAALRRCARAVGGGDRAAVEEFTTAARWLMSSWPGLGVGQRRAAVDAVVEVVYAAATRAETAEALIDRIAAPAAALGRADAAVGEAEVWPVAGAVGLLSRLNRERDLPARLGRSIDAALAAALGDDRPRGDGGFEAGASAALARLPVRLLAEGSSEPGEVAGSFRRWAAAVAAVQGDEAARERMIVDGLERVMVEGREPGEDRGTFAAIQTLALTLRWREGGPARERLLEWFRDPRVSGGDLHVLTAALAGASGVAGVGPTMVLPAQPARDERERMREAYAAAWGAGGGGGTVDLSTDWRRAAASALERAGVQTGDEAAELSLAVELAWLHRAARLRWSGDAAGAAAAVRRAGEVTAAVPALGVAPRPGAVLGSVPLPRGEEGAGAPWAVSYLAAGQNIPVRLARLEELDRSGGVLGPVDAAVLVEAACFAQGGDGRVRQAAQRLVVKHAQEPLVAYRLLAVLPRAPRIESVAEMISQVTFRSLPALNDPSWGLRARRALVERLIEQLAGAGAAADVDRLADLLGQAYSEGSEEAAGAGAAGDSTGGADGPAAPPASAAVESAYRRLRGEAEVLTPGRGAPFPLDVIEGRRAGRRALASGPVQAWAAEQASLAELLAYVVAGETPEAGASVAEVMNEHGRRRRQARHIFEQIKETEATMLRLWLLRGNTKEGSWNAG